jgi:hypothetical protein
LEITDKKFTSYYFALKKLYELHRKYEFGKSPDIPSGFSEMLCRHILSLDRGSDRTHDAIDNDQNKIEIKATGTPQGKTTISYTNKFDILFWVFIEFDTDSAHIYEFQFKHFDLNGERGRKSITLRSIASQNNIKAVIHYFKPTNKES